MAPPPITCQRHVGVGSIQNGIMMFDCQQIRLLFLFATIAGALLFVLDIVLLVVLDVPLAYFIFAGIAPALLLVFGGDAYRKFSDIQMPLATKNEMRCRYTKIDDMWYAFEEIEE